MLQVCRGRIGTMKQRTHVLLHLMPTEALRKARDLASRFERDRVFRSYVVKRLWFLLPACVMLVLLMLAVVVAALMLGHEHFSQPHYRLLRYWMVILASVAWILASTAVLSVFFTWLEKRAIALPGEALRGPRKSDN